MEKIDKVYLTITWDCDVCKERVKARVYDVNENGNIREIHECTKCKKVLFKSRPKNNGGCCGDCDKCKHNKDNK